MLSAIEQTRLQVSKNTAAKKKSQLGQFLTPARTAEFMAGLFPQPIGGTCALLDAGAGIGSLSSAFLERCASGNLNIKDIRLTAFELDDVIHVDLNRSLARYTTQQPPARSRWLLNHGLKVSTGPVVDFRLKAHLRDISTVCASLDHTMHPNKSLSSDGAKTQHGPGVENEHLG